MNRHALFAAILVALGLAACSTNKKTPPPASPSQNATTSANSSSNPASYYPTYYGFTGAHAAAAQGSVEHLKQILDEDPKLISSRNGPGRTPLCIAAMRGKKEAVEYLISRWADVNDRGFEELTPLADMAMYGTTNDQACAEVAEILIAHGAFVDPVDAFHATPLLHAVEMHKPLLARVLLSHGANPAVTFSGTYSRATPLAYALKHSDRKMIDVLMEFKPPLEWVDTDGATPLMWAVKSGKLPAARLLLEHGASPNPTFTMESQQLTPNLYNFITNNSHGFTPLHWAVMRNDKDMVALLLKFKAPVDALDERKQTPLDMAILSEKTEIANLLGAASPSGSIAVSAATNNVPSLEDMRTLAKRIGDGDPAAFNELLALTNELTYGTIFPSSALSPDRLRSGLIARRMRVAFTELGDEAGRGDDRAFQALTNCLGLTRLKYSAVLALGTASAGGNQKAFEILSHYKDWDIIYTSADMALEASAAANLDAAVDYFIAVLQDPANAAHGRYGLAERALKKAAEKGNQKAKAAVDKFEASPGLHF